MHVGVGGSSTNRALHGREIASLDALGRHGEHVRRVIVPVTAPDVVEGHSGFPPPPQKKTTTAPLVRA